MKCDHKEGNLKQLKEEYEKLKIIYNLPEFYELNKLFDIEEVDIETDFLLRRIRRVISERLTGYSRFTDVILNPSNAPMFFFKLLKKLDKEDKENINEIYEKLGRFEVGMIALDLEYNEEKEADFIKRVYELFNRDLIKNFLDVIKKLENNENNGKKEVSSSYFG